MCIKIFKISEGSEEYHFYEEEKKKKKNVKEK